MRPFIQLLRESRSHYSLVYSRLLCRLADTRFVDTPFRHEAIWEETVPPHRTWHYHGEGPLCDSRSWTGADSAVFQQLPRAVWLTLLLQGRDGQALDLWLGRMSGDRDPPGATTPGTRLCALLTAFFGSAPIEPFDDDDEVYADAVALVREASASPTPAQVDALELADQRARWQLRVADRAVSGLLVVEPLARIPIDLGIRPIRALDVAGSGLTLPESARRLAEDPTLDGLVVPPGADVWDAPLGVRALVATDPPSGLDRFRRLELLSMPFSSWDMARIGAGPSVLRALTGGREIGPTGFAALASAPAFAELRWLAVAGPSPGEEGAVPWLRCGRTRHLRGLAFPNHSAGHSVHRLKGAGMAAFVEADWTELRYVDLRDHELPDALAIRWSENPTLRALRHLLLEGTEIGDSGVAALAGLGGLEQLDLHRTRIGEDGVRAIARNNPGLRRLRLGGIGDAGLVALATEGRFTALAHLDLQRCDLGSASIQALGRAEWAAGLRSLELQSNAIDDAGAEAIARSFRRLERLELYQNPLTTSGVRSLVRGLPDLRKLGVYGTPATTAEKAEIRALRPAVEVQL